MVLSQFDPSDISPEVMIDRQDDLAWLREAFESYFEAIERNNLGDDAKKIVCVTGDKGIGKSILARKVVKELRGKRSGNTLFVTV